MGSILFYAVVFYLIYWIFSKFNSQSSGKQRTNLSQEEARYLISLLAKVAKGDGRVNELEARLISETLDDLVYKTGINRDELKQIYNYEKENLADAYDMARKYKHKFNLERQTCIARLTFFLNLAYIDGEFSEKELKIINDIANGFGIDNVILNLIIDRFNKFYTNQTNQNSSQNKQTSQRFSSKDPYDVLGIPRDASFEQVKKRYRELVKKYHPDILMGQGQSEEVIEQSTRKLQEINEAYERIQGDIK